jgi:hypothetical protein
MPLALGPDLTVHAFAGKSSRPLPLGAPATGHAWPHTPAASMLPLAHDAAADRPHQPGIRREREQPSMDAASCSTLMHIALCSAPIVMLAWLPAHTCGPPLPVPADEALAT